MIYRYGITDGAVKHIMLGQFWNFKMNVLSLRHEVLVTFIQNTFGILKSILAAVGVFEIFLQITNL